VYAQNQLVWCVPLVFLYYYYFLYSYILYNIYIKKEKLGRGYLHIPFGHTHRKERFIYTKIFLVFGDNMKAIPERIERVEKIKEALKKTSGSSIKRAVAVISLGLGLSKLKTIEYIELFKDAGYIKVDLEKDNYEWIV